MRHHNSNYNSNVFYQLSCNGTLVKASSNPLVQDFASLKTSDEEEMQSSSAQHEPQSLTSASVEPPLSSQHEAQSSSLQHMEPSSSSQHVVGLLTTSFTPSHSSTQPQQSSHQSDEPSTTKPTQQKSPSPQPKKTITINLTAKLVSDRTFTTIHRRQREWREKHKKDTTSTKRAKQARTREIGRNRFYCKFGSNVRHKAAASGSKGIRGGRQQKIQERMNCPENDHVLVVDEYNTTKTCGSCLHLVELQWQRQEDGTYRRCKGAVNCSNPRCPRRLASNQTTKGRDASGAENIALSGLSTLMSTDSKPLPAFQRGGHTTAYHLAAPYQSKTIIGASYGH